jgi:hypothetical protein
MRGAFLAADPDISPCVRILTEPECGATAGVDRARRRRVLADQASRTDGKKKQ